MAYSIPKNNILSLVVDHVVVVLSFSCVRIFVTPWTAALQATQSFTIS